MPGRGGASVGMRPRPARSGGTVVSRGIAGSATRNASAPIAPMPMKSVRQPIVSRAAPINGPPMKPRFCTTRWDANACSWRARGTRSVSRACCAANNMPVAPPRSTMSARPRQHVAAHEREAAAEERQGGRGQEDRTPPADAIREVSSDVARDDRRDRCSRKGEPELGLRRSERAERPQPEEAGLRRFRDRLQEHYAEHGPEDGIDRVADDAVHDVPLLPGRIAGHAVTAAGSDGKRTPPAGCTARAPGPGHRCYLTSAQASSRSAGTPSSRPR